MRQSRTPVRCAFCEQPIGEPVHAQLFIFNTDIRGAGPETQPAPWRAAHDNCLNDAYPDGCDWYWAPLHELVTSHGLHELVTSHGLREWDEHLSEKKWVPYSNWSTWRERLTYPLEPAKVAALSEVN